MENERYFQHLNQNKSNFGQVTTLDYIDDSDQDMILYHFKDGTKCNEEFIGKINDQNAFGVMELAELSSPDNKWSFVKENDIQPDVKTRTSFQGDESVTFVAADPYSSDGNPYATKKSKGYKVVSKPRFIQVTEKRQYTPYNAAMMNTVEKDIAIEKEYINESNDMVIETTSTRVAPIDADYMLAGNKLVEFTYNGKRWSIPAEDFFANAICYPEEKIVEKVVEKEQIIKKEEHINLGIDEGQKTLIDNMIDMSKKEECDIEMEVTLNLPPVSVYKLIKQVYPEGMAKGFVNIIADRMQTLALKTAVAQGLLAYYDEDSSIETNEELSSIKEVEKSQSQNTQSEDKPFNPMIPIEEQAKINSFNPSESNVEEDTNKEDVVDLKEPENFVIEEIEQSKKKVGRKPKKA